MRGREGEAADAAIRAFFAIDLRDGARAAALGILDALRGAPGGDAVRWERPENLHVTVRFLGAVERDRVPAIVREVRAAARAAPRFRMQLGRVAAFPPGRRPRVVVLEVGPEAALGALFGAVEAAVVRAGLEPERRRYRPHLTLGRARGGSLPVVTPSVTAAGESMAVEEIVLFRSELTSHGAVHTPLERIALGGFDHP